MKKGFSILELIIAITVFGIVGVVTTNAYITSFQAEQRAQLQNSIMLDAKYILDLISLEIANSKIDFEEYYNQCVIQNSCPRVDNFKNLTKFSEPSNYAYGINNGLYSWQFIDSGIKPGTTDDRDGMGGWCQNSDGKYIKAPSADCITGIIGETEDAPTGINPPIKLENADLTADLGEINSKKDTASSFCGEKYFDFDGAEIDVDADNNSCSLSPLNLSHFTFNELYLINTAGDYKTIIGREQITNDDFAISMIKLTTDKDQFNNLPTQTFYCESGYYCTNQTSNSSKFASTVDPITGMSTPNRFDLYNYSTGKNIYNDFVPISPLKVNVKNLSFIVYPDENPSLAYREGINIYPQVTIILEIEPSNTYRLPFFSRNFNLKLQKTVSTYSAEGAEIN